MIEKTLRTTKGRLRIKIPSHLNEVTLGQIIELQENPNLDDLNAISILSGVPLAEVQDVSSMDDLAVFAEYIFSLSNQIKYLYDSDFIPKKVTLTLEDRCTTIKVPVNLAMEPVGAFMVAREIIADEIKDHIEKYGEDDFKERFDPSLKSCCKVLANYFFCRATGEKYDEYKAEEFCNIIKKLRVTEALPIAKHFFTCCASSSKLKISYWHQLQLYWKKRLAFRFLRHLDI